MKDKYFMEKLDLCQSDLAMLMYESPIKVLQSQWEMQMEGEIMKAVIKQGILVDKEELLAALKYDRDQYDKGFAAGRVAFERAIVEQLEAEIDSSDKYIREYDESLPQIAWNKGLRKALEIVKGVRND